MIKIYEFYANENDIFLKVKKSKYLVFEPYKYIHTFRVNNEIVERSENRFILDMTGDTQDALIRDKIVISNNSFHGFMYRFDICNIDTKNFSNYVNCLN